MKNVIKKWWFWLIIVVIIIIVISIYKYIENKKIEDKFKSMGKGMTDYYKETKGAEGYLNKFTYNYSTGQVDYSK